MAEKFPNGILATQLSATARDGISTECKEPEVDAKGDAQYGRELERDVDALLHVEKSGDQGVVVTANAPRQDGDGQRSHQAYQPPQRHHLVENYTDVEELATGGFGTVCRAKHKHDGQHYAVKIVTLLDSEPGSESEREIIREVTTLAALIHDHVVRYHTSWIDSRHPDICVYKSLASTTSESESRDSKRPSKPPLPDMLLEGGLEGGGDSSGGIYFGEEDSPENKAVTTEPNPGVVWQSISSSSLQRAVPSVGNMMPERFLHIKMELCDKTLREWLVERNIAVTGPSSSVRPMCEEDCHQFLEQLLKGVDYIHENKIIHRDLKPPNIFLIEKAPGVYVVKIGDFGLSRLMPRSSSGATGSCPEADEEKLTKGLGTSTYASPEQLQGSTYDHKSDMYSLGVIVFELYHPFGETEMERRSCLLRLREGTLPEDFATKFRVQAKYVKLLTSKPPSDRPSASEVLEELEGKLFCTKDQTIKELKAQKQLDDQTIRELKEQRQLDLERISDLKKELQKLKPDEQMLKSEDKMCPPSPRDKDDKIASLRCEVRYYETHIRDLQKQVEALKIDQGYSQDRRRRSSGKKADSLERQKSI